MDDRRRTLAAITLIVGFLILVAVIVGVLVSSKKIISPVPEDDNAIKIIFITPTPTQIPIDITGVPTQTVPPKITAKPKPTATATLKPAAATTSATPEP